MSPFVTNRITDYILKYAKKIDITDNVLFKALDIAQELEEKHQFFMAGKSSSGLAAAAIWLAGILVGNRLTQSSLCGAICESGICRVQTPTVRNLYRAILREKMDVTSQITWEDGHGWINPIEEAER